MKLSEYAKSKGVSYITAYRWFCNGDIDGVRMPSGTIIINPENQVSSSNKVWIYCQVSSPDKKNDLERQAERCTIFANARGYEIMSVTKEIASGMNDSRKKLFKLIDENPTRILVEHKDRLTRFGFNYFDKLLPKLGCELIVMNRDENDKDDLVKDLVSVVTSFCCKLYGLRRGQHKATKIKQEIND